MLNGIFTSESVSRGHPDKICDQISDLILDFCLRHDSHARVACETLIKNNIVIVAGEISPKPLLQLVKKNIPAMVKKCLKDIGYHRKQCNFDFNSLKIQMILTTQSNDIAMGVDTGGAGDQGTMVGYATNEHPSYLPTPIALAHALMMRHHEVLHSKLGSKWLLPDAKAQVSIVYKNDIPESCYAIVLSAQHLNKPIESVRQFIRKEIIDVTIPQELMRNTTNFYINQTGSFLLGGPVTDTGLTGRKIIVDSYGNLARHGGGAFSGKDPSKVDRSAAYLCRYLAKNIIGAGIAKRCEVQIAYAIGYSKPVNVMVDCFGTSLVDEQKITDAIMQLPFLSPQGLIKKLNLARPIYFSTSFFGHFGRNIPSHTWEQLDLISHFSALR
ncbi:MAG: methionine adenosyltransferase [Methylacidiphilales bacterium]|nr:methionine adenosyltransferase [Candidatus Methylacidiphilales bacterium]